MPALAITPSRLWKKALIGLLLSYEARKQDAAKKQTFFFIFNSLQR